jgi:hypothetical protein
MLAPGPYAKPASKSLSYLRPGESARWGSSRRFGRFTAYLDQRVTSAFVLAFRSMLAVVASTGPSFLACFVGPRDSWLRQFACL